MTVQIFHRLETKKTATKINLQRNMYTIHSSIKKTLPHFTYRDTDINA